MSEKHLFEAAAAMDAFDRDSLIEALLQDLPPLSLESIDVIDLKAQELAAYQAWCRMPPALRCAFCDQRGGALPNPPTRFAPFDVLKAGDKAFIAGRYGIFLCTPCITGAWAALQSDKEASRS